MRFTGICYRAVDPRWSFAPASGDGAAIRGARFNPKGVPALYLSTTTAGAVAEASQGFAYKFHPMTLCSFDVDCEDIVDLSTDDARQMAGVELATLSCAWAAALTENRKPASWVIHQSFSKAAAGILVPSFVNNVPAGATNLVLWKWGPNLPHKAVVFDPESRLPKPPIA
ncbi:MAG: RES domain-containing protein [Rhizobiaceae bacterium]